MGKSWDIYKYTAAFCANRWIYSICCVQQERQHLYCRVLAHKVSLDQQHQRLHEMCYQSKFLSFIPDLRDQETWEWGPTIGYYSLPGDSDALKFEDHIHHRWPLELSKNQDICLNNLLQDLTFFPNFFSVLGKQFSFSVVWFLWAHF